MKRDEWCYCSREPVMEAPANVRASIGPSLCAEEELPALLPGARASIMERRCSSGGRGSAEPPLLHRGLLKGLASKELQTAVLPTHVGSDGNSSPGSMHPGLQERGGGMHSSSTLRSGNMRPLPLLPRPLLLARRARIGESGQVVSGQSDALAAANPLPAMAMSGNGGGGAAAAGKGVPPKLILRKPPLLPLLPPPTAALPPPQLLPWRTHATAALSGLLPSGASRGGVPVPAPAHITGGVSMRPDRAAGPITARSEPSDRKLSEAVGSRRKLSDRKPSDLKLSV